MVLDMIDNWHICISGYREHEGEMTGLFRLWLFLGELRAPGTCVLYREWDSDWEKLAESIWLSSPNDVNISIYAYSWGAGSGFIELARALAFRGIRVQNAVLCDPVYRSRLFLFRWLAYMRSPVIRVPSNVDNVYSVFQRVERLCGHQIVTEPPTVLHTPVQVNLAHAYIDESSVFQEMARKVASIPSKEL